MIEIVYKEEKQEARGNEGYFRLPKNIRQIGDCKGKQKIYLEDYVYTYLKKLSADSASGKAAILLGQYNWADGIAYFFLRGALEITCMEVSPDNLKFDEMIQQIREEQTTGTNAAISETVREYESIYPLTASTAVFKGKKPTGVRFPGNIRQDVPTWKKVVETILIRCNRNPECHQKLMDLRGKVSGRNRVLLGKSAENMRSPVKIDDELYVETHYDTETLLRILTTRILDPVQYDYSRITITVRN